MSPDAPLRYPRPLARSGASARRPTGPRPPVPPLGIGSVLARTFSIWGRNFPANTALSVVMFLPLIAWTGLHTSAQRSEAETASFNQWSGWAYILFSSLLSAALIYGVLERLRGRRASFQACFSTGLARIFPVLGVCILIWVYFFLAMLVAMIPVGILSATSSRLALPYLLAVVGLLILAVVTARFYVAVPVAVIEKPGVRMSIHRSAALTKGNRWRLLGVYLILNLPGVALGLAATQLLADGARASQLVTLALDVILFAPLGAISTALVYHDLRVGLEGASIEDLTKVFE